MIKKSLRNMNLNKKPLNYRRMEFESFGPTPGFGTMVPTIVISISTTWYCIRWMEFELSYGLTSRMEDAATTTVQP